MTLRLIGLNLSRLGYRSILPNLLIPLLYCGPLTAQFLSSTLPLQRHWSYQENLRPIFTTWIGIRNHIVVSLSAILFSNAYLITLGPHHRRAGLQRVPDGYCRVVWKKFIP